MAFTLDAMSIYGQDTRMLDSLYRTQEVFRETIPTTPPSAALDNRPPSRCLLLALPLELRQQIYFYALPKTYKHEQKGIIWLRGSTSLLATSSQIHDEAGPFLYSRNTFAIDVAYDCATFSYRWSLLRPSFRIRRLAFPEQLGARYINLLRNFQISIHLVDPYTGMSKFNYGGPGLLDGLRDQVKFLCQSLARIPKIHSLDVRMFDSAYKIQASQRVLEPFLDLQNVQRGTVHANLDQSFRKDIHAHLNGTKKTLSLDDLPHEIRQQIYRCLLPGAALPRFPERARTLAFDSSRRTLSSLLALTYLNRQFHMEVQTFIFHNLHFRMTIYPNLTYEITIWDHSLSGFGHCRRLPISEFENSIYKPAISQIRELCIMFSYIPLAIYSPRYQILETFLDTFLSLLESAPLKRLSIEYVTEKQRSSGAEQSRARNQSQSRFTSTAQSLGVESSESTVHLQALEQTGIEGLRLEDSETTASPTAATSTMSDSSSSLLQTPPILYLVAKLNPIMAQVKSRTGGSVWINRRDQPAVDDQTSYSPFDGTARTGNAGALDPPNVNDFGEEYLADSPQRTILRSNRSASSRRRSRGSQMLFSDVPR